MVSSPFFSRCASLHVNFDVAYPVLYQFCHRADD